MTEIYNKAAVGINKKIDEVSEDAKCVLENIKEYDEKSEDELRQILQDKKELEKSEKGYILMKLNCLEEAYQYISDLSNMSQEGLEASILQTGYRKGCDGGWYSYDDSCGDKSNRGGKSSGDGGGCCTMICMVIGCGGLCSMREYICPRICGVISDVIVGCITCS